MPAFPSASFAAHIGQIRGPYSGGCRPRVFFFGLLVSMCVSVGLRLELRKRAIRDAEPARVLVAAAAVLLGDLANV